MVGQGWFGASLKLAGLAVIIGGGVSSAHADSFYLENGQVIDGTIIDGTLNTLMLRSANGVRPLSMHDVERVVLKLADGSELSGKPLRWKDGTLEIRSGDDVLKIADGAVLRDETTDPGEVLAAESSEETTVDRPGETITILGLPSFTLASGDVIVGKILHATGSMLTIRSEGSSAVPLSKAQIKSVAIESQDGESLSGQFIGWEGGLYRIQVGDRELYAGFTDDVSNGSSGSATATAEVTEEAPEEAVSVDIEQADAAIVPQPVETAPAEEATTEPEPTSDVGAGGPANETAVAALTDGGLSEAGDSVALPASIVEDGQHLIETVVEAVDESGQAAVFKFQLSKPAARPLVVLYAVTEASAKAGEDFEAKSGVITFSTGSTYAEIQVPIIDDDQDEEEEKFNLFLSGDPETIAFSERQIAVTINDND